MRTRSIFVNVDRTSQVPARLFCQRDCVKIRHYIFYGLRSSQISHYIDKWNGYMPTRMSLRTREFVFCPLISLFLSSISSYVYRGYGLTAAKICTFTLSYLIVIIIYNSIYFKTISEFGNISPLERDYLFSFQIN